MIAAISNKKQAYGTYNLKKLFFKVMRKKILRFTSQEGKFCNYICFYLENVPHHTSIIIIIIGAFHFLSAFPLKANLDGTILSHATFVARAASVMQKSYTTFII